MCLKPKIKTPNDRRTFGAFTSIFEQELLAPAFYT